MFTPRALVAVSTLLLVAGLSAASLVAAGDSDRTVRGPVGGGKTDNADGAPRVLADRATVELGARVGSRR